jgi:hypothetical protein
VELPDADPRPPPAIAGVTPARAFLARHTEIVISGYSSHWDATTRADLGPNVTITNTSAPTPDMLVVDFGVDPAASVGPRDVTVLDADGGARTAPGALDIEPPVALSFDGTLAQGSIVVAHVTLVDRSTALDATATQDPFGNLSFPDLSAAMPSGLAGTVVSASPYAADVEIFIDEPTVGPRDFDLVSSPPGGAVTHFPLPAGVNVAARAPLPLIAGQEAAGNVATKYGSALYSYSPPSAAPSILDFVATSGGSDPAVLLLPADGSWAEELAGGLFATWLTTSTDPIYAVFFDDTGSTGGYLVGLTATAPAASAAATPTDATAAGAVTATALPFVLTGGQLTSTASQDWVRVTTGPQDAGKHLHVQSAGDPHTFLDVTLYDADGTTSIGGNESGGPVNARAGPLAASTTYFVVFSAGAGFNPTHGAYAGIIRLE